jgi:hypothetical protein
MPGAAIPGSPKPFRAANLLGAAAIATWGLWWAVSLWGFGLQFASLTWLPTYSLGFDFLHNYLASRAWLDGINPYIHDFGDPRAEWSGDAKGLYAYPPATLPWFAWTAVVPSFRAALAIWWLVIAAGCALCLWQIQRFRREVGWSSEPLLPMLALVLWSSPVVFALERGNCDVLVLFCVVGAALALGRPNRLLGSPLAAAFLGMAAAMKLYPLAVLAAVIALRRYLVLAVMLAFMLLLVGILAEPYSQWLDVMRGLGGQRVGPILEVWHWLRGEAPVPKGLDESYYEPFLSALDSRGSMHSPGDWWFALWVRLGIASPVSWPLFVVHLVTLAPVTLWGCWATFRAPGRERMVLPVLLWIMTIATYWMPLSFDYNLIFLPLLVMCLWDRRDPGWLQVLVVSSLLPWWLPFGPVEIDWVLLRNVLKIVALYVLTLLMIRGFRRLELPTSA